LPPPSHQIQSSFALIGADLSVTTLTSAFRRLLSSPAPPTNASNADEAPPKLHQLIIEIPRRRLLHRLRLRRGDLKKISKSSLKSPSQITAISLGRRRRSPSSSSLIRVAAVVAVPVPSLP